MNQEEYPSDSDASDEDFRPDIEESNSGSELDSEEEKAMECTKGGKGTKRKRKGSEVEKKKAKHSIKPFQESEDEKDEQFDEEEEKRRTDALWASFLGGESNPTGSEPSTKTATSASNSKAKEALKKPAKVNTVPIPKAAENEKKTVAQLFEFAGEQIAVDEEGTIKTDSFDDGKPAGSSTLSSVLKTSTTNSFSRRGGGGGLGAVLNQLNKKNKLTMLEKTKLDWTGFKRQEGIAEELQTHNKGKDGFLERRDFLERTDLRQFEIEKSFRQTKRSNR